MELCSMLCASLDRRRVWGRMDTCTGFPCGSAGKESAYNVGDLGLIPGLRRFPGEVKGYPLQYSGLENSMDCIVRGVAKSWTRLSDFHSYLLSLPYGPALISVHD